MTILVVEDETGIADSIDYALSAQGYSCHLVSTIGEARRYVGMHPVQLIILDVGLPDGSGFDWCIEIRQTDISTPILFLTARNEEPNRIFGLDIGGDDYVVKPFSPRELIARIRSLLRRCQQQAQQLDVEFVIDRQKQRIQYYGVMLDLARYEYRLLAVLIKYPGRIYSRRDLMNSAWDDPDMSTERTIDSHIRSLRKKLHQIQPEKDPIETHRGMGYSLRDVE